MCEVHSGQSLSLKRTVLATLALLLAWPALEPVAKLVVAIVFAVTGIDLLVQVYRLAMQQITGANTTGGTPSQAA